MKRENNSTNEKHHSTVEKNDASFSDKKDVASNAREEAMDDIEEDADLSIHSPNDDLDEGETARLGENKNDLT